jgi:hypothetical protein
MSALTNQRDCKQLGVGKVVLNELAVPQKANTLIYSGALVQSNAGYAQPGATGVGLIALGVADLVPQVSVSDSTGLANGALVIRVSQGVFRFNNSSAADLIAQANCFGICYVVDDNTVALTSGGGTRSKAGQIIAVDSAGVWVAIGVQCIPDSTSADLLQQMVGQGDPEELSANGVVSIVKRTSRFTVSGTKAWTLANGVVAGQRKTLYCVSQASTPVGVVTLANGVTGQTTITFGAASALAGVELEWDVSATKWKVVGVSGTVAFA